MHKSPKPPTWRRLTVLGSAFALVAGGSVVVANFASAASGPSVLDYSQCSNGGPGTTAGTGCAGGWINGILNASNSQYHEDQVTAQRLTISFPDKGAGDHSHSVTLNYLDRKGTVHAYDSLAQVNTTQTATNTDAIRCQGITSICPGGSPSMTSIVDDTHNVGPATDGASKQVSTHQLSGQKLMVWGATFPASGAMTEPQHDNNATDSGDDYASTKITFLTNGNGTHKVQLLFGGHLAAGLTAADGGSDGGWGTGLGAGNVSGGPYHIKLAAIDGASAGNRDNQIMSGAIIPITPQGATITTSPSKTSETVGSSNLSGVTDTAEMTPDSGHAPTGTMTFTLYGPLTAPDYNDCTDPDPVNSIDGNVVGGPDTGHSLPLKQNSTTVYTATSNPVDMTGFAPGVYQWVADYVHGTDKYNFDINGDCGDSTETVTINLADPTGTSTQTITDTVTVAGALTPSGHVNWYAYDTSDCSNTPVFSDEWISDADQGSANNILDGSSQATSEGFTPDPADGGTPYYWKVTYSGDDNNNPGTVEACGVQLVRVQNAPTPPPTP